MKKSFNLQCRCYFGGKNLCVIFTQHCSRCREDKLTLPCVPRPGRIWTQLCQYSLSITSYFLFRGFPPLNRNPVLFNRGYRSFCHKFSSSPSYSCLWSVLILRHTANNARMASADGRISGALTGSHLLQEITYTHHARASPQARASCQALTEDLPEDSTIIRKEQGKSKKYPSALHLVVGCRLLRMLNNPCTK